MTPRRSPQEARVRCRWKHGPIPVLGLIGGIGGGKSEVARRLAGRGAWVIDADVVGHQMLEEPTIRDRVVLRFGPGVLEAGSGMSRAISRRALGPIVFGDPVALRDLEAILHPAMRHRFAETIAEQERGEDRPCIVLDAAVLLEAGWDELCDRVVFVDAPRTERERRVGVSRGWSERDLAVREQAQWPIEEKRRRADWVISNAEAMEYLDSEVDRLLCRLEASSEPAPAGSLPSVIG